MNRGPGPKRRAPLARGAGPARSGRPRARPAPSVPGRAEAASRFRVEVLAAGRCVACGDAGELEAHHALPARWIRDYCRYDLGLSDVEALRLVYAPEVGVPLCGETQPNRCHPRHTNHHTVVPGSSIPESVHAFVADLGPAAVEALRREHP